MSELEIDNTWVSMEDEWPPDSDKRYLFYNKHIDFYSVDTMDGISRHEKRLRQEFQQVIQYAMNNPEEDEMRHWILHRHAFTHWTLLKDPPD